MSKQLNHEEFKKTQKKFDPKVVLILENLEHDENIGSAFRLADAFNVSKIYVVTDKFLEMKKVEKTARNCSKTIPYEIISSTDKAISAVREDSYTPISVEICDDSVPLRDCNFANFDKVALLVGNERHGVSETALNSCDLSVHIDMFGVNSSLNVSTALGIALYKCVEDRFLEHNHNCPYEQ